MQWSVGGGRGKEEAREKGKEEKTWKKKIQKGTATEKTTIKGRKKITKTKEKEERKRQGWKGQKGKKEQKRKRGEGRGLIVASFLASCWLRITDTNHISRIFKITFLPVIPTTRMLTHTHIHPEIITIQFWYKYMFEFVRALSWHLCWNILSKSTLTITDISSEISSGKSSHIY